MANEKPSNKTSAASLPLGLLFGLPALLGVTLTIAMYCILSWSAKNEFRDTARAESLRSLAAVKANFAHLYSRLSQYSNLIAQNLNNREDRLYAILEQSKTLWPEINFSFYDRSSEPYPIALQALSGDALPLPRTTRYMLHNALLGNTATDITLTRGFLSLSTITPAPPGKIRAAMATLPLDPNTLGNIKKNAQADLAILPLDDNGERLVTGNASTTFLKSWDSSLDRWGEILKILPDIKNEIQTRNIGSQTIQASFEPLKDSFGTIVGVLVVAPLTAPAVFSESTRMLCACLTGLGVAILALLALYLYGDRLISSIAADINFIASENAVEARLTTYKGRWPVILETALRKTALTLKNYRSHAKTAALEQEGSERKLNDFIAEVRSRKPRAHEHNLRLFDNSPAGIFQTDINGRLNRVNYAFAVMLGYESPHQVLEENETFANLCISLDESRNPLNAIMENGGKGVLALRKNDRSVSNYAISCTALTSSSGDNIGGILEGFIQDCDADEQLQKALRDKNAAEQGHSSLALLLASTARRLQAYLLPPDLIEEKSEFDDVDTVQENNAENGPDTLTTPTGQMLERRKSILPVKEFLSDMYQIAMNEAVANPRVDVPLDFERFLQRICNNAMPNLKSKGISMQFTAGQELLARLSSPAPMLRQTLQKVLLLVSSQVRGGYVILNAVQDPASHSDPTMLHALFEISWTAFLPERWLADNQATGENMRLIFNAPINPALSQNSPVSEAGILDIADELETVRYIVAKMDGHINEWLFNNEFRSMQISVPLPRMGFNQFFAVDEYGIYMPKEYSTQPGHQESGGSVYSDIGSTVFTDDAYSHTVDLFGIDTISIAPADYNEEASADADAPTRDMGLDILLVDDNLNNRMLFSLFLSGAMHRITEAHNGREGVEAFQNASYDVIFMDMEMPMMDGYQATRIIRALEADNGVPSTPIVGMTAHALPEFRRQCMISGCSDFLYKPFTKSALTSMLDAFIQLKLDARRRTS